MRAWLSTLSAAAILVGCGTAPLVDTARFGDLPALKRGLAEEARRGTLDASLTQDVAEAVAGRELLSAQGEAALRRLKATRACAKPLMPVLRELSRGTDDAAAEAALIRLELGDLSHARALDDWEQAAHGGFRAVAARAAVAREEDALRREYFTDPDGRVRLNALRAAFEARQSADLDDVLEAARVEPDALTRTAALRAAAAIGGERPVLAFKDYWPSASPEVRLAIVDAWALPSAFETGGKQQLFNVAEATTGLPQVAALVALQRRGEASVQGLLLGAARSGSREERGLALAALPLTAPAVEALELASRDPEPSLAVLALERLAAVPAKRADAIRGLERRAAGREAPSAARLALARLGVRSVTPQLTRQLADPSAALRRDAARGLLALGLVAQTAPALADSDPGVRTDVACAVLLTR